MILFPLLLLCGACCVESRLTEVRPDVTHASGGSSIRLYGSHFNESTIVLWGNEPVVPVRVESEYRLEIRAPRSNAGWAWLSILGDTSLDSVAVRIYDTMTVRSMSPRTVPYVGGTQCKLTGRGFFQSASTFVRVTVLQAADLPTTVQDVRAAFDPSDSTINFVMPGFDWPDLGARTSAKIQVAVSVDGGAKWNTMVDEVTMDLTKAALRVHFILMGPVSASGRRALSLSPPPSYLQRLTCETSLAELQDFGWNFNLNSGRLALAKLYGGSVTTTYSESVPEAYIDGPARCESCFEDLCRVLLETCSKSDLIFTTSWGYMDATINVSTSPECSNSKFVHLSGYKTNERVSAAFSRIYQWRFLSGIAAGSKIGTSHRRSKLVGYLAAFNIPEVARGISAFALGCRFVDPDCEVRVLWTETWHDTHIEAAGARYLHDVVGCDIIAQHSDTTAPQIVFSEISRAGKAVFGIGYNSDQRSLVGDTVLTSVQIQWAPIFSHFIDQVLNDRWVQQSFWEGADYDAGRLTDVGSFVTLGTQNLIQEVHDAMRKKQEFYHADGRSFLPHRVFCNETVGPDELHPALAVRAAQLSSIGVVDDHGALDEHGCLDDLSLELFPTWLAAGVKVVEAEVSVLGEDGRYGVVLPGGVFSAKFDRPVCSELAAASLIGDAVYVNSSMHDCRVPGTKFALSHTWSHEQLVWDESNPKCLGSSRCRCEGILPESTACTQCDESFYTVNITACEASRQLRSAVAVWREEYGILPSCSGSLPESTTLQCDAVMRGSGTSTLVTAVATIGAILCFGTALGFAQYHKMLRLHQPELVYISLFAAGCLNLSILAFVGENSDSSCAARVWVPNLSLALMIGAVTSKVHKVYIIANNRSLKLVRITKMQALRNSIFFPALDAVLLLFWHLMATPTAETQQSDFIFPNGLRLRAENVVCSSSPIFTTAAFASKAVAIGLLCYMSFASRKCTTALIQPKWLCAACYNMFLWTCVTLVPFFTLLGGEEGVTLPRVELQVSLLSIGTFFGTLSTCALFFAPLAISLLGVGAISHTTSETALTRKTSERASEEEVARLRKRVAAYEREVEELRGGAQREPTLAC